MYFAAGNKARPPGRAPGGGGDLGGLDLGSLLGGLGSSKDGGLKFKFHGNYCGLGHGDATYKEEPVDSIDAICKTHDQCYDNQQYLDCLCDHNFIKDMRAATTDPKHSKELQKKANLMAAWFESSACKCFDEEWKASELKGATMDQKSKCKHKIRELKDKPKEGKLK
eukprot:Phypoly_transcript_22213.p1 GENE.Phypoly_transcript_22213~~Phypoly_transcript_22213.p1  ORF type:complete len:167 (+),score=25.42 Phypoly_transcript_22213:103-603(+)